MCDLCAHDPFLIDVVREAFPRLDWFECPEPHELAREESHDCAAAPLGDPWYLVVIEDVLEDGSTVYAASLDHVRATKLGVIGTPHVDCFLEAMAILLARMTLLGLNIHLPYVGAMTQDEACAVLSAGGDEP